VFALVVRRGGGGICSSKRRKEKTKEGEAKDFLAFSPLVPPTLSVWKLHLHSQIAGRLILT